MDNTSEQQNIRAAVDRISDVWASDSTNFLHLFELSGLPNDYYKGRTIEGLDISHSDLSNLDFSGTKIVNCVTNGTVFPDSFHQKNLINADADNVKSDKSSNAEAELFRAVKKNDVKSLEKLIKARVNVDCKNPKNGYTALMVASTKGYQACATLLIEAGANVNHATTNNGYSALMIASWHGHDNVVQCLIDADKIDVNFATNSEYTALIAACFRGHKFIVEMLIDAGADPNKLRGDKPTALVMARQEGHTEIEKLLIEAGATA